MDEEFTGYFKQGDDSVKAADLTHRNHFGKNQIRTKRGLVPGRVVYMKYNKMRPLLSIIIGFGQDKVSEYVVVLQEISGGYYLEREYLTDMGIIPYGSDFNFIWNPTNHIIRTQKKGPCFSEVEEIFLYFQKNIRSCFFKINLKKFSCSETLLNIFKNK